jgi:Rps23 Pro-64 3,4-dihydroxylase Tpa1-like proline 4-hydroxylase
MKATEIQKNLLHSLKLRRKNILSQWNNPIGTDTRHFFVDNLLPEGFVNEVFEAFPMDGRGFIQQRSFREKKRTLAEFSKLENSIQQIFKQITTVFQNPEVIRTIGDVLSIPDLEADPLLYAGGASMMFEGDFLNPHIDNSHDANREKYRRLNLLFYVSPDWKLENGGNFELWDNKVESPKSIISKFNRLVVMETNKQSFHSVSPVLTSHPRCCISNYYFQQESQYGEKYFHVTSFTGRPNEVGKRVFGKIDNLARNIISKNLKIGRGKNKMNK